MKKKKRAERILQWSLRLDWIGLGSHILQAMHFSPQVLPNPDKKSKWEKDVKIESTLTLPAVTMSDSGNITCIGANEAGINSATTNLLVVGKRHAIYSVY